MLGTVQVHQLSLVKNSEFHSIDFFASVEAKSGIESISTESYAVYSGKGAEISRSN